MTKLTYMPTHEDQDTAEVSGIVFKAYEPVEIKDTDQNKFFVDKLKANPWFSAGEIDKDRHDAWKRVRDARAAAEKGHAEASKIEAEALTKVEPRMPEPQKADEADVAKAKPIG